MPKRGATVWASEAGVGTRGAALLPSELVELVLERLDARSAHSAALVWPMLGRLILQPAHRGVLLRKRAVEMAALDMFELDPPKLRAMLTAFGVKPLCFPSECQTLLGSADLLLPPRWRHSSVCSSSVCNCSLDTCTLCMSSVCTCKLCMCSLSMCSLCLCTSYLMR